MQSENQISRKKIFSTVALLLGATIGAGFASGREVITFFGEYGYFNAFLLVLTIIGLAVMIFAFARIGKLIKAESVTDVTKAVFGKFASIFNVLIPLSLFGSLFAMIAGLDSLAESAFANYNFPWLSIVICLAVILIVSGGLKSVLRATSSIVPAIVVFLLIITSAFILFHTKGTVDFNNTMNIEHCAAGIFSTLLYIGNNLTTGGVILTQMGGGFTKDEAKKSSILFASFFVLCVTLVIITLFTSSNMIFLSDMPMVQIAKLLNPVLGIIYSIIIFLGISMTLTACTFALTKWFKKYFESDFVSVIIIITLGYIISRAGFGTIIDIVYPIKGGVGFVFSLGVLIYYLKHKKQIEDN